MRHWLFEIIAGEDEGFEFIVGADAYHEAREIAEEVNAIEISHGWHLRFWRELTEEEAEASGLDEY